MPMRRAPAPARQQHRPALRTVPSSCVPPSSAPRLQTPRYPGRVGLVARPEEPLDHEHILPLAIELAVALMDAHLAPAEAADHRNAGLVRGEDLAHELVRAGLRGRSRQGVEQ